VYSKISKLCAACTIMLGRKIMLAVYANFMHRLCEPFFSSYVLHFHLSSRKKFQITSYSQIVKFISCKSYAAEPNKLRLKKVLKHSSPAGNIVP